MKVPIDTIPVELRIKIYEYGDVSAITQRSYPKIPWSRTILLSGVLNDIEALEVASIQGEDQTKIICPLIALTGNLPLLQWARSDRLTPSEPTGCDGSLKRRRVTPFPWDSKTCTCGAMGGSLAVMKWLKRENCPWDSSACVRAAKAGHVDVFKWLQNKKEILSIPMTRVLSDFLNE